MLYKIEGRIKWIENRWRFVKADTLHKPLIFIFVIKLHRIFVMWKLYSAYEICIGFFWWICLPFFLLPFCEKLPWSLKTWFCIFISWRVTCFLHFYWLFEKSGPFLLRMVICRCVKTPHLYSVLLSITRTTFL